MLNHYLKSAFRNLKKNKTYSLLSIGGFSIGFATFILMFAYVFREFNIDSHYLNNERIYRVINQENNSCMIDYNLQDVLTSKYPDIEASCPLDLTNWGMSVLSDKNCVKINSSGCTTNEFFNVFSVSVIEKISDKPFADINSAIVTKSLANKLFPNQSPLGKSINIDNFIEAQITAVIEDFAVSSSLRPELLINSKNKEFRFGMTCNNGDCFNPFSHFLLLKEGMDSKVFEEKVNLSIGKYQSRVEKVQLQELMEIYLTSNIEGNRHEQGNKNNLLIFLLVSFVIVLITVLNYLNYSIALQYSRVKDLGVRMVNGAKNRQLNLYYLSEAILNVVIALVMASIIVVSALPLLNSIFGKPLFYRDFIYIEYVLIVTLVILFVIFSSALFPAFLKSSKKLKDWLSGKSTVSFIGRKTHVFTVLQFAVSIVLISTVLIIQKQMNYIKYKDLGFNKEYLLKIDLTYDFSKPEAFKEKCRQFSFVKGATLSIGTPGRINISMGSGLADNQFSVHCIKADKNFLDVFEMRLKNGRLPEKSDFGNSCIINETAFKKFEWENIEGKRYINGKDGGYSVIGIIEDINVESMHKQISPTAIIFDEKYMNEYSNVTLRLVPGDLKNMIAQLESVWDEFDSNNNFSYSFYDDVFNSMYEKERRMAKTINLFSMIAMVLTCLGIFGLIYQKCILKSKEIGVRKVNGAKIYEVMAMLNSGLVKWVAIAFIIAMPIAYYSMQKWLENFAYKTELSWWVFALSGIITVVIAISTVSWQTWRAANRNPVEALRYE